MITLNKPTFIKVKENKMYETPVSELVVNYQRSLGQKQIELEPSVPATEETPAKEAVMGFIPMGYFHGYVLDKATGNNIFGETTTDEDTNLKGTDLDAYYHKKFIGILQELNPDVKFTNTI
jgi:hypothetical protein